MSRRLTGRDAIAGRLNRRLIPRRGRSAAEVAVRLAAAVASGPAACVLLDQRLRLIYANAAAYGLVGIAPDRSTLASLVAAAKGVVSVEDRGRLIDLLVATRRATRSAPAASARRIDISTIPDRRTLDVAVQPIRTPDGRDGGLIIVVRDATSERELDRLKDELVANISHELQTPLASVRACAEMLIDRLDDGDPALRDQLLGIILAEAKGLSELIENVLDLSRLEGGQLRPRREEIDLRWAVDDVVAGLEPQARTRGQTIDRGCPPVPCLAFADEQMVRVIVTNLVGNAVKYGAPNGRIAVEVSRHGELARITVADDGPGIPADALPRVFERFYRVSSTTDSSITGAGLGRALGKGLAEAHGGRGEVASEPGCGARFTVWLPTTPRR